MNKNQNSEYNTDLAWEKLHSRLKNDNLLESKQNVFSIKIMKIAAIILLMLGISALIYNYLPLKNTQKILLAETNYDSKIKEIKLSDGSKIYLSSNSKLYYPKKFIGNKREVKFQGEAFFEIAKNTSKVFVVKTKNVKVKVLGTSFDINTKFKNSRLEVFVKTGKVIISKSNSNTEEVFFEAGDLALLENGKITKKTNENKNYLSWKTKIFDFQNTEMKQVIKCLNKAYNANILIKNKSILKKKLHTKFKKLPLNTILEIIAETYNLTIEKQGNIIILY